MIGTPLPSLAAIVSVDEGWGIGYDNRLIVENPDDLRRFAKLTRGTTLVMGRRTLESLPGGRPLPGRRTVVLTRDRNLEIPNTDVATSVETVLDLVRDEPIAWVTGGSEVYRLLLPYCSRAFVTMNRCRRRADARFPNLDADPDWRISKSETTDADGNRLVTPDGVPFEYDVYERLPRPSDSSRRLTSRMSSSSSRSATRPSAKRTS